MKRKKRVDKFPSVFDVFWRIYLSRTEIEKLKNSGTKIDYMLTITDVYKQLLFYLLFFLFVNCFNVYSVWAFFVPLTNDYIQSIELNNDVLFLFDAKL